MTLNPPSDLSANIPYRVMVIEDNDVDAGIVDRAFRKDRMRIRGRSFECARVRTLAEGVNELDSGAFDVILLDLGLPDAFGMEAIEQIIELGLSIPVVVLTGNDDAEVGVEAMRIGASDHLVKNEISADSLPRAVRYAIERRARELSERALDRMKANDAVLKSIRSMLTFGYEQPITSQNPTLDIAAVSYRAGLLGGDFCEVLDTIAGTTVGVVGKISTQSVHASPLALQIIATFRALVTTGASLTDIANAIDRYIAVYSQPDQAGRLFLFELDETQREIRYVSGGTRAWLFDCDNRSSQPTADVVELHHQDLPLGTGLSDEPLLPTTRTRPNEGLLLIATNGGYNTRNAEGERFGYERLTSSLQGSLDEPAGNLVDTALDELRSFSEEELAQDATLVVIKLNSLSST